MTNRKKSGTKSAAARSGAPRGRPPGKGGTKRTSAQPRRKPAPPPRPSRFRLYVMGGSLAIALVGLVYLQVHKTPSPSTGPTYLTSVILPDPAELPGLRTTSPPWDQGYPGLRGRLEALGFSPLLSGGISLHIHQHLDIYVHGKKVTVPAGIGIPPNGAFLSPLHTHDTSGMIHVESPKPMDFALGQFFAVWGVRLTSSCIGGLCDDSANRLRVFVDGHPATGDVPRLKLFSHEEIVVTYGTEAELPTPIPSSYGFPPLS